MKTFINASAVKLSYEKINPDNIDRFIDKFNKIIIEGNDSGGSFTMNDVLDDAPSLNDEEFKLAVEIDNNVSKKYPLE